MMAEGTFALLFEPLRALRAWNYDGGWCWCGALCAVKAHDYDAQ